MVFERAKKGNQKEKKRARTHTNTRTHQPNDDNDEDWRITEPHNRITVHLIQNIITSIWM